uniref:unspecific monooxygenase n=1 Tax=Depressaria pastinacella TaxID=58004 RepID=Q7YZS3_DEPPA|nr:cytochrome P450 [Depressaria pastinacella]
MHFLIALGILLIILYLYGIKNHKYWEKKGVPYVKPIPFFGTNFKVFMQRICISDQLCKYYEQFPNEKFVGAFIGDRIGLVLREPELIKRVMVTDFQYFHPRGVNPHKTVYEPLLKNLFTGDGDMWKLLRQRITPAFTSGKLKAMFPLIVERAERLQIIAATAAESHGEVDVRELMARFTTDFIGACGFGIDADTLNDEESTFRRLGKRIFTLTKRDGFVFMLKTIAPEIFKNLHMFAPEIEKTTVDLVTSIMQQRKYKHSGRNDFIDFLLELKGKGKIVGESVEKRNPDGTPKIVEMELDDMIMAAQVFIFFAAGFETSSSTTSYTLHQLAFHPEEQKKCQDQIDEVLSRHGGKLSYEAIKEMTYLDMIFKESMRMYPSLGILTRRCVQKYTFPGTNLTIDEDVLVCIPVHALHNDEKYFDEPEKFKPERFSPENIKNIPKYVYLPFGDGPRACIGERLGHMQSLAGLAALLSKFSVAPSKNTLRQPITDPTCTVVKSIKGGLPLSLVARKV